MTGRLFLHIGPPKSATTSLQVALEGLVHERYRYDGVFQPRERNSGSLAQRLHNAVLGGSDSDTGASLKTLRDWITSGGIAVVSEEMLSLQQGSLSTADKLGRIGRLLSGIPTTVLVTLRDPVEALPSLFQELWSGLPLSLQLDFPRFCSDGRTDCYDYALLSRCLEDAGLDDLRWLDFRVLSGNQLTTGDLFGPLDLWQSQPMALEKLNTGAKAASGSARRIGRSSLRAIGRAPPIRAAIDRLGLRGSRLLRWGAALSDRVKLGPEEGFRTLVVPPQRAEALRAGHAAMLERLRKQDVGMGSASGAPA